MRANSGLFLLAQAVLSSAFVIPHNLPVHGLEAIENGINNVELSLSRVVRVPCTGCKTNVPADLILDFNLPASSPNHITLNGIEVLPIKPAQKFTPLKAALVPASDSFVKVMLDLQTYPKAALDYSLLTSEVTDLTDGTYKQDTLELRISAVDGTVVDRVPGVKMDVRQDVKSGAMQFGRASLISPDDKACDTIRCVVNKMISKAKELKNSAKGWRKPCGKHGDDTNSVAVYDQDQPTYGHGRYGDRKHHGGKYHHGKHHHSKGYGMFARVVGQIVLPIVVGILAGMVVSALGLMFGKLLVVLFTRFRARRQACREGRRGFRFCRRRRNNQPEEPESEAGKGLLSEEQTEDVPPAYADNQGIEVVVVEKE